MKCKISREDAGVLGVLIIIGSVILGLGTAAIGIKALLLLLLCFIVFIVMFMVTSLVIVLISRIGRKIHDRLCDNHD